MSKKPKSVFFIQCFDGKLWTDNAYTSHRQAQYALARMYMPDFMFKTLSGYEGSQIWSIAEKNGWKIKELELAGD